MVANIFKSLVVFLIVVAITGYIGLFIMAGVASTHDVVPIPVPSGSHLSSMKADYTSAFRAPLTYNTYRDIDGVTQEAFRLGGREIYRGTNEVVYEGFRGGIRYFTSYLLDRQTNPHTLTMITVVRVHGRKSGYLWKFLRPIHKRLAPYLLDRVAQAATD